jgi:hypothetical protein
MTACFRKTWCSAQTLILLGLILVCCVCPSSAKNKSGKTGKRGQPRKSGKSVKISKAPIKNKSCKAGKHREEATFQFSAEILLIGEPPFITNEEGVLMADAAQTVYNTLFSPDSNCIAEIALIDQMPIDDEGNTTERMLFRRSCRIRSVWRGRVRCPFCERKKPLFRGGRRATRALADVFHDERRLVTDKCPRGSDTEEIAENTDLFVTKWSQEISESNALH